MGPTYTMFARGGSIAYAERFETSTFLQATRRTQATAVVLLGAMAGFLEKQPPAPDDLDNPLRKVFLVPLPANFEAFGRRFGVDVYTMFNMTEVNCPLIGEPGQLVPGTCGRRRRGVDVRLVDANDCEVPQGTLGELIVRADRPWALNSGYCNDDAATVAAWRNGWFHTGDCFREDEHGNFFFLDRRKDMIRRRGENISSMEVEAEINAYPGVAEATTVGVCGEGGEDEILAIVVPREASPLDPVALLEFLRERLPHFMVPRFVRQVVELPKTPTMKVRKQVLRDEGLTADTWDRERAGIQLRAQPLSTARAPQGSPAPHSATPRRP
jgi:crotonobetaine/carnitine-CoA ligase